MKKHNRRSLLILVLAAVLAIAFAVYGQLRENRTEPAGSSYLNALEEKLSIIDSTSAAPVTEATNATAEERGAANGQIHESGTYDSRDEVALYLHTYGHLPSNYITKSQAQAKGWPGGSLEPYAPGCSIGGDKFGNFEGKLPRATGRKYYECDIDTRGASSRGSKRLVYSTDGLIYYTEDHYETFQLLYDGSEGT